MHKCDLYICKGIIFNLIPKIGMFGDVCAAAVLVLFLQQHTFPSISGSKWEVSTIPLHFRNNCWGILRFSDQNLQVRSSGIFYNCHFSNKVEWKKKLSGSVDCSHGGLADMTNAVLKIVSELKDWHWNCSGKICYSVFYISYSNMRV